MAPYDHKAIEQKWQKKWEKSDYGKAEDFSDKPKKYILFEFPYPSGAGLHVGHVRPYVGTDVYVRYQRLLGYNVLYPIGWDAFGLPTENFAIKNKIHPREATDQNIKTFKKQYKSIGISVDWDREVDTTDPKYYKWTQWIFLQLYNKGLAYKKKMAINWCPSCKIGLAHEEVVNGTCERCGAGVEQREKEQWMLAITKYADRLLSDLDTVDYLDKIKTQQVNWIGRSEGVNFKHKIKDMDIEFEVYDSIPQTFMAQTFAIIAPEHEYVEQMVKGTEHQKSVMKFVEKIKKKKMENKFDIDKDMEGIFTGRYIENYLGTGRDLPIWVASFALIDYGTGIVGCSAHDERDWLFAKKYDLPLHPVLFPADKELADKVRNLEVFYREPDGVLEEPKEFLGQRWDEVREPIIDYIEKKGLGKRAVNYKLRDWIFSRQHYWGEPIPMVDCSACGWVPVSEEQLPLELPDVKNYEPTDTGESPLATITDWVNTTCPKCGGDAKRETDTMPNWAGSSWYFLRYIDPHNNEAFADKEKLKYWLPIDLYDGGMEHTTLHLLYSRFWHKFLYDEGHVPTPEPYARRISHGMVLAEDNKKMSKSLGNVINPDDVVNEYGADSLRLFEMFMGPFEETIPWSTSGVVGTRRFLEKVWNVFDATGGQEEKDMVAAGFSPRPERSLQPEADPPFEPKAHQPLAEAEKATATDSNDTERTLHKTIKQVTEDLDVMKFNTAVSALMKCVNTMKEKGASKELFGKFIVLLSPFAPHVAEELWEQLGNKDSVFDQKWPQFDPELVKDDLIELAIQVNGKLRGTVEISPEADEQTASASSKQVDNVAKHLEGKTVVKIIYLPGRMINFVIK
ncbi:MAG: leucine--tRNA ligase [Patescibacteria group bacterium]